jgi:predicted RecB family nuclease
VQLIDGRPVYSATDLVGFLACEHLTNLERAALQGLVARPMRADPEMDRIAERGMQHERRFLEEMRAEGHAIVEIERDGSRAEGAPDPGAELRAAAAQTLAAMRSGADVVYQATFFDGRWRGHADFLRRIEAPSDLGSWSYEVWDTKLARHVKGSAVLQLCLYSQMLADIQGRTPEWMTVALGGSAHAKERLRVSDYAAYARLVREMFQEFVTSDVAYPPPSRPDPVEHCDVCRWSVDCVKARRRADDLSLVAGITARQRRGLREQAVDTRRSLASLELPILWPIPGTGPEALARVRDQARIQVKGEREGQTFYELLAPRRDRDGALVPNLGLLSLPEPSAGDLFFDIEGDPFALDDGVDYLFGIVEPGLSDAAGAPTFHTIWSIDEAGDVTLDAEKRAFQKLIDFFVDRLNRDPKVHIYHYASYEPTAIGRLMGRHATREDEVDRLMRGKVFVDLYRAVRQGLRASVESYSIKKLEPLYGFQRTVALRDAGSSILEFETWLELGGERVNDRAILDRIAGYNRDDCVSTLRLRDWLEQRRPELAAQIGQEMPRRQYSDPTPTENISEYLEQLETTVEQLAGDVPADPLRRTDYQQARWVLANLLGWHRREEKPAYWRYFQLLNDLTDEERLEEPEPMAGLVWQSSRPDGRSAINTYRFPLQDHDISTGRSVTDPATGKSPGTIVELDVPGGLISIRTASAPRPTALVPELVVRAQAQKESLLRIGQWAAVNGLASNTVPYRAARDLVRRVPPAVGQVAGEPLAQIGEPVGDAARRIVLAMTGGCLAVQGPPGSGKSTTGADMIVALVVAGRRVGVTSNSHKVIGGLLDKVAEKAREHGVPLRIGQKPASDEGPTHAPARVLPSNEAVEEALAQHELDVVGGTPWLWARGEMEAVVEALFVDEAGQVSLANAVAVSAAAPVLVLLGDPQQLDQPLQGTHPPGTERSALAHLLGRDVTMPPDRGLFLDRTWRLHPDICSFTSDLFYEDRLHSQAGTEIQEVVGDGVLARTGIRWLPIRHTANANMSVEEAVEVARQVNRLIDSGAEWIHPVEGRRRVTLNDVLIITPYNAQVREIGEILPGARAGTVDKFQGQEAAISIYSMATSSIEEAPRGMEFLYNLHRLNVATSRARCVAAVVASPDLIRVRCRSPRQMQLANGLARLLEFAEHDDPVEIGAEPAQVVTR